MFKTTIDSMYMYLSVKVLLYGEQGEAIYKSTLEPCLTDTRLRRVSDPPVNSVLNFTKK